MKVVYIIQRDTYIPELDKTERCYYDRFTPFGVVYADVKHKAEQYHSKADAEEVIETLRQDENITYKVITYVTELNEVISSIVPKEAEALYFELGTDFTADESKYYAAEQYDVFEFATLAEREAFIRNRREQLPADTNGYPY